MKVKGKDKYFIASSTKESDRDPNIDKKNFYRLFEPENYLPKEMVEWKEDSKFKGYKYNAKLFDGFMDKEEYSPYGGDTSFMTRKKLKPEFMPERRLTTGLAPINKTMCCPQGASKENLGREGFLENNSSKRITCTIVTIIFKNI